MPSMIGRAWIYATARIVNDWSDAGTGFFVERREADQPRFFLVTNKHVLGSDPQQRDQASSVILQLNTDDGSGLLTKLELPLELATGNAPKRWREHLIRKSMSS